MISCFKFNNIPLPEDIPQRVYLDPLTKYNPLPSFVYKIQSNYYFNNSYQNGCVAEDIGSNSGRHIKKMKYDYYYDSIRLKA